MNEMTVHHQGDAMQVFTAEEEEELRRCEEIIEVGLQSGRKHLDAIRAMADALEVIKTKTLYRRNGSFGDYCRTRFGISQTHANRMIRYVNAMEMLASKAEPIGSAFEPTSEGQIRALSKLNQEGQKLAWEVAVEAADGEEPTNKDVAAAVEAFKTEYPARPSDKTIAKAKIMTREQQRAKAIATAKSNVVARVKKERVENGAPKNPVVEAWKKEVKKVINPISNMIKSLDQSCGVDDLTQEWTESERSSFLTLIDRLQDTLSKFRRKTEVFHVNDQGS